MSNKNKVVNSLSELFVKTQKDYYFGNISKRDLLMCRADRLQNFLETLSKFSVRGKISGLCRVVDCYSKHSKDDDQTKRKTIEAITDFSELLELIAVYSDDIDIWGDFTTVLIEKINEDCNE